MPVTLGVAWRPAEVWDGIPATTRGDILRAVNTKHFETHYMRILQTSFDMPDYLITASPNGFVHAALKAYNTQHHLTIRPEDVWFSILSQVGYYINAHAAELPDVFVSHKSMTPLAIGVGVPLRNDRRRSDGPRYSGASAREIARVLGEHIQDPALRAWVTPSFSTTTLADRAVAAALFLGAMQTEKGSGGAGMAGGGLPSVTLLGEVADYRAMLQRVDMLERLRGEEPRDLARLLRPVLRHMVATFELGATQRTVSFWSRMAYKDKPSAGDGSGRTVLAGWLTTFCYWSPEGESRLTFDRPQLRGTCTLDGVTYPCLDVDDVPPGAAAVPVVVDHGGERLDCTLVAASAAIHATDATPGQVAAAPNKGVKKRVGRTAIQPMAGWFLCENRHRKRSSIHQVLHGNYL